MSNLSIASNQWATRPFDERFTSLDALFDFTAAEKARSEEYVNPSRSLVFEPVAGDGGQDHKGLRAIMTLPKKFRGQVDAPTYDITPTHWSFGQVAALAGAQGAVSYLRDLPSPLVADCLNWGLHHEREASPVGLLVRSDADGSDVWELAAATGPGYGRIHNARIAGALRQNFGDGVTGPWCVPGEFGKALPEVTKENTTIYASDRDMFVFLANEQNRIEFPNRRNGKPGLMARGFYVWNSEVGSKSFGIASFLFDYVCQNRTIWGVEGFQQITMRHSSGAPDRFLREVTPLLASYSNASAKPVLDKIAAAQSKVIGDDDAVTNFFKARKFSGSAITGFKKAHEADEGRPIETLFDATNAVTAYARGVAHQDERVTLERAAGNIFALAA